MHKINFQELKSNISNVVKSPTDNHCGRSFQGIAYLSGCGPAKQKSALHHEIRSTAEQSLELWSCKCILTWKGWLLLDVSVCAGGPCCLFSSQAPFSGHL